MSLLGKKYHSQLNIFCHLQLVLQSAKVHRLPADGCVTPAVAKTIWMNWAMYTCTKLYNRMQNACTVGLQVVSLPTGISHHVRCRLMHPVCFAQPKNSCCRRWKWRRVSIEDCHTTTTHPHVHLSSLVASRHEVFGRKNSPLHCTNLLCDLWRTYYSYMNYFEEV